MTRLATLFLGMALIAILSVTAVAETETYGEEILFRGVPWLIDAESFVKAVAPWTEKFVSLEEGYNGSITDDYVFVQTSDYLQFQTGAEMVNHEGLDIMVTLPEPWIVAGYDTNVFGVNALLSVVDGEYSKKASDAIIVQATYSFDTDAMKDIDAVREDLKAKLTAVYGKGTEFDSIWTRNVTWMGSQNTYVMLRAKLNFPKSSKPEYDSIEIDYGRTDIDELYFAEQAKLDRDKTSTDGL